MVYPIFRFLVYAIRIIQIKRISGVEHIPDKTTFIIASNHEKLIDPLYMLYPILKKLNKKIHFIATPTWWFLGEKFCREWAGTIPLFSAKQAYGEAKKLIKSGEIVGIYPEGGTRRTKNPKTGAVRLAIETNAPILPIGIKSSYMPFNSILNIGKPVYVRKGKGIKKQARELMEYVYKLRREINKI